MKVKKKICILMVDPEIHNLTSFKANFRHDFLVHTASSINEANHLIKQEKINVIICDLNLSPCINGIQFLNSLSHKFTKIITTGRPGQINEIFNSITSNKIFAFIEKPWNMREFRSLLEVSYVKNK